MRYKGELDGIVLGVLHAGPAHGYEIVKRVRAMSDGILGVGEAKLYPCLHRLEQESLVDAEWVPQEGKPARRVYTLTTKGRAALAEKRGSWEKFSTAVATLLGAKESPNG
ncbi:MAG: PadR family transcriptional regulator [Fimbriimonadales bacterium]